MIDPKNSLTVLHDNNSVFTNQTEDAEDYARDTFTLSLSSTEDYHYIGFHKPFNALYVELTTANTQANTFTAEVFDGTLWNAVDDFHDDSKGYTRSGFITWEKAGMKTTEIDGEDKFFIRLRPSDDHTATTIQGINLVFSDDIMMQQHFFEVNDSTLIPSGQSSHIMSHVAARNEIVQWLRKAGYIKRVSFTNVDNYTRWELHDIHEIRQAATFMALSNIFFNLSDNPEDGWFRKYQEYRTRAQEELALVTLSTDEDDDGVVDDSEKLDKRRVTRISY